MRRKAIAAAAVLSAAVAFAPARAAPVNLVRLTDNRFDPSTVQIAKGETVTWVVSDGTHTLTASDGRFSYPDEPDTLGRGDVVRWTFTEDETFTYLCKIHFPVMRGTIVVGEGSPPPPPPVESHRAVPSQYPTITAALAGAPRGTIIDVAPGEHHYAVVVSTSDITIRGTGSSPNDVVISGDGERATGILVGADNVHIENLTLVGHGVAGLEFADMTGFVADRVVADGNGLYGIYISRSRDGLVRDSTVGHSAVAGVGVDACDTCAIERVTATENAVGISIVGGRVSVRRASIHHNGSGIVVKQALDARGPDPSTVIQLNVIADNTESSWASPDAVAAGVWMASAERALVTGNVVTGHGYGVVVSALGTPSRDSVIAGNTIDGSRHADIAWDGLGAEVCFIGNERTDGSETSSDPPLAQTIYACTLPATVGVPYPIVNARLLGAEI